MKRIISIIILIATLTIVLSACGMGKVKIEDYEWKMRTNISVTYPNISHFRAVNFRKSEEKSKKSTVNTKFP